MGNAPFGKLAPAFGAKLAPGPAFRTAEFADQANHHLKRGLTICAI